MAFAAVTSACAVSTKTEPTDPRLCPQTSEFGNYGCARVFAVVQAPPQPWPANYRYNVRVRPARAQSGFEGALAQPSAFGPATLTAIRWVPPVPRGTDTVSVWVVASMFDDVRPIVVGRPLPVFAADSSLLLVRFVAVGALAVVDTVALELRGPVMSVPVP
jgi:hypothetical protein